MPRPSLAALILRVGVFLMVSACDVAAPPGPATSRAIDPCQVVTREEAEAAAGFSLNPGQAAPKGAVERGIDGCHYETTLGNVSVSWHRGPLAAGNYARERQESGDRAQDVPGLGDGAFIIVGWPATDLHALRGDLMLSIGVSDYREQGLVSDDERRARVIELARVALGRL